MNEATRRDAWILVTGGSSGLGLECALRLARAGRAVVVASRDAHARERALRRIDDETRGAGRALSMDLDLAETSSVRSLVDRLDDERLDLDAIVCNAGLLAPRLDRTAAGIERTFAVNHLGHFLLVNLLLGRGRGISPSHVVVVSSAVHDPRRFTLMPHPRAGDVRALARDGATTRGRFDGRRTYATSKLCNLWFAYELARRAVASGLDRGARGLRVSAFDPGLVPGSGLARHQSPLAHAAWTRVLPLATLPLAPFFPTIGSLGRSGRALARLVLEPDRRGTRARYVASHTRWRESVSSRDSYDEGRARDLWDASVELSGLRPGESPLVP